MGSVGVTVRWGGGTAILLMGGYALPGVSLIATTIILATSAALAEVCALLITILV